MASTDPIVGTVINRNEVQDKKSGPVAVSITLGVGLVYEDGANGWKNAPIDGSIHADELYWNPTELISTAVLGGVIGTFYGEGARVIGVADTAIVVDQKCKASTNVAQALEPNADPANSTTPTSGEVDAIRDWIRDTVAIYKGHALEVNRVDAVATNAVDTETNCVFEIVRG